MSVGKTGIRLSRLGIGTASNSGEVQRALGREAFNRLIRYAYDQDITYIDTAESYKTHDRLNPMGHKVDGATYKWEEGGNVPAVIDEVKTMRADGRGVIGMKLIGNGDFKTPEERERSIRFVMQSGLVDAVVIGFASTTEIDEAIERINRALADA